MLMDKTLATLTFEFRRLSDKKPNEAVNEFKLNIVNKILAEANKELGSTPIDGFSQFNIDAMPTNSDVLFVLALYQDCF